MRTNDGHTITANAKDPWAIIRELHQLSNTPAPSDKEFMTQTAKRVYETSGAYISDGDPAQFVQDLIALGFLVNNKPTPALIRRIND